MKRAAIDVLAEHAAGAEPAGLDDSAARRLIDAAIMASGSGPGVIAREPHAARPRVPAWGFAAAVAVAAIAIAVIAWPRARPVPEAALLELALPTGDQLRATPGARFEIVELAPRSRRLALTGGTVVFDVAHVVAGQRFEVAIPDATVVATGTVFAIAVDATGARVHVFEGSVEVHRAGGEIVRVPSGADWVRDEHAAPTLAAAIVRTGSASAAARARSPVAIDPPVVAVAPVPPIAASEPAPIRATPPATPPATIHPSATAVRAPEPARDELAEARADVAAARFDEALALATAHGHPAVGSWELVRADALRGLGRKAEATDALVAAAAVLTGASRASAAYTAAYVRFHELHDPDGALHALAANEVDAVDAPFEERGLALHVEILLAGDDLATARPLAERYVARFPRGDLNQLMRRTVARALPSHP